MHTDPCRHTSLRGFVTSSYLHIKMKLPYRYRSCTPPPYKTVLFFSVLFHLLPQQLCEVKTIVILLQSNCKA